MGFTMDGYRDLDALTDEAWAQGLTLGAKDRHQLKQFLAATLHFAIVRTGQRPTRAEAAQEFYNACWGIVDCAQMDELI